MVLDIYSMLDPQAALAVGILIVVLVCIIGALLVVVIILLAQLRAKHTYYSQRAHQHFQSDYTHKDELADAVVSPAVTKVTPRSTAKLSTLAQFVHDYLQKGYSHEQITQHLMKQGYPKAHINQAYLQLTKHLTRKKNAK